MKLPFTLFLALRYLRPKRTFVSIITLICIIGVTLGVAVPILVISVMRGFDQELRQKVIGFDAHLTIHGDGILQDWRWVTEQSHKIPGVVAVAPFVQGRVLAEYYNQRMAPYIRGIDPAQEEKVTSIKKFILPGGDYDLTGNNALIGSDLADLLGIGVGDTLELYSPSNLSQIREQLDSLQDHPGTKEKIEGIKDLILPSEVVIAGIFKSGRYAYDSDYVLVPLNVAQELYGLEDVVHGLSVKTIDANRAAEFQKSFDDILHPPDEAVTWIEQNSQLFDAIMVERNVMFFLLLFIVIVAAFGIMSTLITTTVQKTREIGVIKALGAQVSQILWIFLAQGMVVGFFGTLTGLGLGMAVVQWRNDFRAWLSHTLNIQIFPSSIYQFDMIPAQIVPRDVAIICISGFVICSVAALIPAWFAARLDPVKALRFD